MYNKYFEYLLSNNPQDVLSKNGVKIRKIINPLFLKLVPLTTKNKLTIESKCDINSDRPIIYAATHGFRDDIAFTLMTIQKHAYLLYGSIPDFYESFDGIALWANGSIIIDRKSKESRKAAIPKMEYAIDLSANILMYPEGVWNKNPNAIVQKLYTGIYKLAKSKNALVVPIATILVGNKGYSIQGEAYDMTKIDNSQYKLIIKRIENNINKIIDLDVYNNSEIKIIKEKASTALQLIEELKKEDDIEQLEQKVDCIISICEDNLDYMLNTFNEEYWSQQYNKNIEIEKNITNRIMILLKDILEVRDRICTDELRDKMVTLKWQLISKYCQCKRSDFQKFEPISKYWDDYLEKLIKTANGLYDYEIENTAHYVDQTEINEDDVFKILDNIPMTNQNCHVLAKIRKSKQK